MLKVLTTMKRNQKATHPPPKKSTSKSITSNLLEHAIEIRKSYQSRTAISSMVENDQNCSALIITQTTQCLLSQQLPTVYGHKLPNALTHNILHKLRKATEGHPKHHNQKLASKSATNSLLEHAQNSHRQEGWTKRPNTNLPNQQFASKSVISRLIEHAQCSLRNEGWTKRRPKPPN